MCTKKNQIDRTRFSAQSVKSNALVKLLNECDNPLTATIDAHNLSESREISTIDVFQHSRHIVFHDFFPFEASRYSHSLKRNRYINT